MIRQFANISTWRKYDITIEPHVVHTVNFIDTLPNIFVINNPNVATLKVGISAIPRTDSYEFKVEYNTTETMGRPIGTGALYILNDSSVPVKITLFSIEKDFDPALLKNMNVALAGYTLETSTIINGFMDGVTLPVKIDSSVADDIKAILNHVNESKETEINQTLNDIKGTLNNIAGDDNVERTTFTFYGESQVTIVPNQQTKLHFKWLQRIDNISGNMASILMNGVKTMLALPDNSIVKDITFEVKNEDEIMIVGDAGTMFSGCYWME